MLRTIIVCIPKEQHELKLHGIWDPGAFNTSHYWHCKLLKSIFNAPWCSIHAFPNDIIGAPCELLNNKVRMNIPISKVSNHMIGRSCSKSFAPCPQRLHLKFFICIIWMPIALWLSPEKRKMQAILKNNNWIRVHCAEQDFQLPLNYFQ